MNQARSFLLIAWLLVAFLIWEAWQKDQLTVPSSGPDTIAAQPAGDAPAAAVPEAVPASAASDAVPNPDAAPESANATLPALEPSLGEARLLTLSNDVLRLTIDTRGGNVVGAELLDFGQTPEDDAARVELLSRRSERLFHAQSGLIAASAGAPAPTHQSLFEAEGETFNLAAGAEAVELPLRWTDPSGLELSKRLVLRRGSYVVEVHNSLHNRGEAAWRGNHYRQLLRVPPPKPKGSQFTNPELYSFVGAAWYNPVDKFEKLKFEDFDPKAPLALDQSGGWTAMLQHYFFAAWIPPAEETVRIGTAALAGGQYLIREVGPAFELAPGEQREHSARLYVGPKLQDQLADVAPGLELAIDYGIFTLLAEPLFILLSFLHSLFGNWGWAIIALVVLIKLAFFKLSETQYKSFAKMRAVQPRIEALKERYGDDKQKFQMAMMELYKKEKINPMGGCLPILVQIPVFVALYWVLLESVELRHAPWILWIDNLTARDPYFVLPIVNMATMYVTQLMTPMVGMDPMQKRIMQIMPLAFGFLFAFFPAGLVLYWATNGLLGLAQQWVITRRHGEQAKAPARS